MFGRILSKEEITAFWAGTLDRAAAGEGDGSPAFRVARIVQGGIKNRASVEIEIDGAIHEARVRRESDNVHLTAALRAQPPKVRERIKHAALCAASLAECDYLPFGVPLEPAMWQRYIIPTAP